MEYGKQGQGQTFIRRIMLTADFDRLRPRCVVFLAVFCHQMLRYGIRTLLLGLLLGGAVQAHAKTISLLAIPQSSLGLWSDVLVEEGRQLSLQQARQAYKAGAFQQSQQTVPLFGIGSRPVWVRIAFDNPSTQEVSTHFVVGTTWIDELEVYAIQHNKLSASWKTGDAHPYAPGLIPAKGFVFNLTLAPGTTEIYLRAQTQDPMVLPIRLEAGEVEMTGGLLEYYAYGAFYGFLAALAIYNCVLYLGLREKTYLYYSLLLISFIFCNIGYMGHGAVLLWPGSPEIQRYIIQIMMVLYAGFGLLFAGEFLELEKHANRLLLAMRIAVAVAVTVIGVNVVMRHQEVVVLTAFIFVSLCPPFMVFLGAMSVRERRSSGYYFLMASSGAMVGTLVSTLNIWGVFSFHPLLGYHAAEIGVLFEATLLALALAERMRKTEVARFNAEKMARHDPLTGLHNRRSFWELAVPIWGKALSHQHTLSLVLLDVDFFKKINDHYGHHIGDCVLADVARLLTRNTRSSDIVVRWGGEEFLLLLPGTTVDQAYSLVERIRQIIAAHQLFIEGQSIAFTASFGVASREEAASLADLIHAADERLYQAKASGRNRVISVSISSVETLEALPA